MAEKAKLYKPNSSGSKKKFTFKKSGRSKGYDTDWEKYRRRFLFYNPNCYCCGKKATVVDHLRAHKGDMVLFKNLHNHAPFCADDHNYVTGKFDKHKIPMTKEKCDWIVAKRKRLELKIKIVVLSEYVKKK